MDFKRRQPGVRHSQLPRGTWPQQSMMIHYGFRQNAEVGWPQPCGHRAGKKDREAAGSGSGSYTATTDV